MITKPKWK